MSFKQSGDILLQQGTLTSPDPTPGESNLLFTILFVNGFMEMTESFETAAALSMFGGNFEDDGTTQTLNQTYWANLLTNDPARKYVSRTQNLLRSIPATSANLVLIDEAAALDLQWFLDTKIASEVRASSSIPALNRVAIAVNIEAIGREDQFSFTRNWEASV